MKTYTYQDMESYLKNNPMKTAWEVCIDGQSHHYTEWRECFFLLEEEEARKFAKDSWGEYENEDGVYQITLSKFRWDAEDLMLTNSDMEEIPDPYKEEPKIKRIAYDVDRTDDYIKIWAIDLDTKERNLVAEATREEEARGAKEDEEALAEGVSQKELLKTLNHANYDVVFDACEAFIDKAEAEADKVEEVRLTKDLPKDLREKYTGRWDAQEEYCNFCEMIWRQTVGDLKGQSN